MRNAVSEEEALLWHAAVRDVRPLKGRRMPAPPAPHPPSPAAAPTLPAAATVAKPVRPAAPPHRPHVPDLAPGASPGVDRSTAERLRRGAAPIESRLDLHGMTQAQAHEALDAFLAGSYVRGRRVVLVVTGKGPSPQGGALRREVPRWLNTAPNRSRVLMFAPAQPGHGGGGALYVLLKRRRA